MSNSGLEGVVVAETRLSHVDGEGGTLEVDGLTLEELVEQSLEQVYRRLVGDDISLGEGRLRAYHHLRSVGDALGERRTPLEKVRLALASLPSELTRGEVVASLPVALAVARHGQTLPPPDPSLSHVEDFWRLFFGEPGDRNKVKALATYLVTVSEHGMNASTFACRVVASTGASPVESAVAALAALSGPLHGGAPGPVLDLLDSLKGVVDLELHLAKRVESGERLMGFGHRVYRARDPRAEVLRAAVLSLTESERLRFAEKVEQAAGNVLRALKPHRPLHTNVEFYTAVLLDELGFEREWFTPLFATGRVLGWMAHYQEQRTTGRLIRPAARYVR